ncbi:SNARE protein PEP12/VAM3/Syntaxin 7/Syntaxin 17 [Handroanthus impetiginosus]|uniref:SNARE protein PEP12/VAM3/Syntaxin 7/Syntaxin 17 n=1 Tax=Handroanthus impetiginosus TaxID=429701 RepID=A0A2G9G0K2_9LAMI|nr:SNARE protein PEP12/VAM3/Syntaxin 7/Syntaxin 17 [Handroanthus impetiginosus]
MSFQDLQNSGGSRSLRSSTSPSYDVAAALFQINTAVAAFRRLVDAIGTSKDTPDHRLKLQNTRQRIMNLVKETSAKLKSLNESDRGSNVDPSRRVHDAKLARDFQTTLQEFQKVQQLASERESTFTPTSSSLSFPTVSGSSQYAEPSSQQENKSFLMEQKRQDISLLDNEIAFNEVIIEERGQGIKEIEDQIGEANEIFKDLAVLIHDQGVTIDDIGQNVEASAVATTQSKLQLSKASKSGKSKASRCWWVLAIIVVVLVILLLVLIL